MEREWEWGKCASKVQREMRPHHVFSPLLFEMECASFKFVWYIIVYLMLQKDAPTERGDNLDT